MTPRLVWIDDSDPELCRKRLDGLRERFSSWEFVRWDGLFHDDQDEAYEDLATMLGTKSMFSEGKVVYCYGLPECQAEIAKRVESIDESILFLIIGGMDKRTTLYKTASSMDLAEMDEPLVLKGRDDSVLWVKRRAKEMGVELDATAAVHLVDFVGPNPARLLSEVNKLKHLGDGKIFPWMVDDECHVDGNEEITLVVDLLTKGNYDQAQESLGRMLSKNESFDRICGFLYSWLRRMAIAEACKGDYQSIKGRLSSIMKYQKPESDDDSAVKSVYRELILASPKNANAISKLTEKLEKEKEKTKGKAVPMFPKPGALFFACEQYQKACKFRKERSLGRDWVMGMIDTLAKSQELVRAGKADPKRVLHNLLFSFANG